MGVAEIDGALDAESRIPKEAKKILHSLAADWSEVADAKALEVVPLKGAMTNEVYQIVWKAEKGLLPPKVLVRIYGEGVDVFFDRENEIQTFEFMSKHGQGPRLLGRFSNGRVEEFIHARACRRASGQSLEGIMVFLSSELIKLLFSCFAGVKLQTLSAADLRDQEISLLIASKLKEFHELNIPGPRKVHLWNRLRNWLSSAKGVCPPEEVIEFRLETIKEEIDTLENVLSREKQKIGFCHNDLQYGNIMIDEETRTVTIIDYEYASYNPVAYDIANHFCEMAADYHTETPHVLDFSKYPGLEERRRFVEKYLNSSGNEASNFEVGELLEDIEKFTTLSHLSWALWGIISEHVNGIDFDYLHYARQRFEQYQLKKQTLLGCGK